jgi:hypothetical protein
MQIKIFFFNILYSVFRGNYQGIFRQTANPPTACLAEAGSKSNAVNCLIEIANLPHFWHTKRDAQTWCQY